MDEIIKVKNLSKNFMVDKSESFIKRFFSPKKEIVCAVKDVNFEIKKGEIVGFIGPNGAGKSTTIKMLTGVLTPSGGEINVCGLDPHMNRKNYVSKIGVVFGQRSQLWWDLPVKDTFTILKKTYKLDDLIYKENMQIFDDLLSLGHLMNRPVRQLSLGQRMRCEVAAAFIHNPQIIFLDEPTIGLDLLAKDNIISFIKKINKEKNTTILLTTHDLSDIDRLCKRIIIIDKGIIIYDNINKELMPYLDSKRKIMIEQTEAIDIVDDRVKIIEDNGVLKIVEIDINKISLNELLTLTTQKSEIKNIKVYGNSIEDVIRRIYGGFQLYEH